MPNEQETKAAPEFKVGDWFTHPRCKQHLQVMDVTELGLYGVFNDGDSPSEPFFNPSECAPASNPVRDNRFNPYGRF